MFHILVVCTANVCRSPAARAFLERDLFGYDVQVSSAGVDASNGDSVDRVILSELVENGYPDIVNHRARLLLPSHVRECNLILCLDRGHLERVHRMSTVATGKSFLLGRWDEDKEVEDPVGGPVEAYRESLELMRRYCKRWSDKIIGLGLF